MLKKDGCDPGRRAGLVLALPALAQETAGGGCGAGGSVRWGAIGAAFLLGIAAAAGAIGAGPGDVGGGGGHVPQPGRGRGHPDDDDHRPGPDRVPGPLRASDRFPDLGL